MTKRKRTILLVDDDPAVLRVLAMLLRQAGYEVEKALSAREALPLVEGGAIDLVLTDLRMPGRDGMKFLGDIKARWPDIPVVMLTAHGNVEDAVAAMKLGATEFLQKPFEKEEILFVVEKVLARPDDRPPEPPSMGEGFVGESDAMTEVFELINRAARSEATVLVRGETGTGKELVARAIHERSPRADGPFVKVHCAGLPETLLESELFGYEKGAFTGASSRKPGRIELAQGGTLFLDEIGDVTLATQVKLLRVLQDREFERVGGTSTLKADVRFVAATHRDLEQMLGEDTFREDLFYRLNVIPIWSPPLRERRDDIVRLARHFCERFAEANGRDMELADSALIRLQSEAWPGNVRQLQNIIERLVVLSDGERLEAKDVERELRRTSRRLDSSRTDEPDGSQGNETETLEERRRRAEEEAVRDALEKSGGNRSQAARLLGVSRRTFYNKLEEYGVQ